MISFFVVRVQIKLQEHFVILFGVITFFDDVIIMPFFGTFELRTKITEVVFINRKTPKMTKNRSLRRDLSV